MMAKVTRDSLMTLEAYAKARPDFRKQVIGHKKHRAVRLGEHITLLFEDELTVRYQKKTASPTSWSRTTRWCPTAATSRPR